MAQSTIPQRAEIDPSYTWRLSDIYPTDDAWEREFKKVQELIAAADKYKGKLAESPALLYECLRLQSEVSKLVSKLYQYSHLQKDLDNRVSTYQAMNERAAMLGSQAGAAYSFVEPELLLIEETRLRKMAEQFPRTDEYDLYIKELIRSKEHIRSQEVEEVLALASTVTRGPDSIFTMLDDADLTYPTIKDSDGNDIQLTKQRFYKFLESSDRRLRRDASDAFYSAYRDHLNTLGASLSAAVNKDVFYTKVRRYNSCLEAALDGNNIPTDVYHSLIETTERHIEVLHKYVSLRKRLLKLPEIRPYDMNCPLFPDEDYEVPYDEAVRQVIESCRPLGDAYSATLVDAFRNRWVDVFETQGKGSGAYSYSTYTVHPYVLMNYNDTVDNMFTLAHEMGHALHSHMSNSTQLYPKARYAIFVAEVASTLNEGLLLDYLLKKADDQGKRLYLLNRSIDNALGTFFAQVLYAHFELRIHQEVENGGALSPAFMSDVWKELTAKYFGPELVMDEFSFLKWSRIPHFYNMYYVFQYATSFAASQAILTKFMNGEEGIVDKYLKLLSSGGSDYPIELLKICGVDMATADPIKATIDIFSQQVDEVDRLTR